jgi:hypothetical protein
MKQNDAILIKKGVERRRELLQESQRRREEKEKETRKTRFQTVGKKYLKYYLMEYIGRGKMLQRNLAIGKFQDQGDAKWIVIRGQ